VEIAGLVKPPELPTIVAVAVVGGDVAMLIVTGSPAGGHTEPAQIVPDSVIEGVPYEIVLDATVNVGVVVGFTVKFVVASVAELKLWSVTGVL